MHMQSTYWLEKVLKMISFYVNALLCTLQHIFIHAMQLSGLGVFWGGVSRYAATPLTVALSPGHSDITRFRP
jgi:hypothetical protein